MSLKQTLLNQLQANKHMTFQEMERICHEQQKKASNGEKRLRDLRSQVLTINGLQQKNPDYDPNIGVIRNEKGAIIAYTYNEYQYIKAAPQTKPVTQYRTCCYSFKVFQTHGSECPIKKEVKHPTGQLTILP